MSSPTPIEIKESIAELTEYRDRIHSELQNMGRKLNLSPQKVELTLKNHNELTLIEKTLSHLKSQLSNHSSLS